MTQRLLNISISYCTNPGIFAILET